jgi:RNA-binding protein YhbY
MIERILGETGADPVQRIGQMLVLFRRNAEKPKVTLPAA